MTQDIVKDTDRWYSNQWYSNKELYEKFLYMFTQLEKELQQTRDDVKKYNNLVGKLDLTETEFRKIKKSLEDQISKCNEVQSMKAGKWDLVGWAIKLWPIAISTIFLILALWQRGS